MFMFFPLLAHAAGIADRVKTVVNNLITMIIPVMGALVGVMVVAAAVTYFTAAGDTEKIKHGHMFLISAVIGLGVLFLARPIITMICTIVGLAPGTCI